MVSATDQNLWQGPKQEVRESRTSGFGAQPEKFETITVTIGYKNKHLLRLRVTLAPARAFSSPEPTILLVCAKDRDLWQGPKQEVRESRTSGFCAQPQKFEQ